MKHHTIVIGGGASGLAAAIMSARRGDAVTLLERADRVGKKLLATGNGRCNLANTGAPVYFGEADFALRVLSHMPVSEILRFFSSIGLPTRADAAGRVYPACNQAAAVLDVLRAQLDLLHVAVVTGAAVRKISHHNGLWQVDTPAASYSASRVIVCCGGLAAPKLGAFNAYGLLTSLGCTLVPPAPALTPLQTETAPLKGLSGLRLPATLTLCADSRPVARTQGEVLFADYGVSGVCAMQLARPAHALLSRNQKPFLYIDFSPALGLGEYAQSRLAPASPFQNEKTLQSWLASRRQINPAEPLLGALPRLLRQKLASAPPAALPRLLCAYPLAVTAVRGFDQAQVTQGGVSTRDFAPATLAHKALSGLHVCGEMLNVDGDCGGFNLQFAFATGLLAGAAP